MSSIVPKDKASLRVVPIYKWEETNYGCLTHQGKVAEVFFLKAEYYYPKELEGTDKIPPESFFQVRPMHRVYGIKDEDHYTFRKRKFEEVEDKCPKVKKHKGILKKGLELWELFELVKNVLVPGTLETEKDWFEEDNKFKNLKGGIDRICEPQPFKKLKGCVDRVIKRANEEEEYQNKYLEDTKVGSLFFSFEFYIVVDYKTWVTK